MPRSAPKSSTRRTGSLRITRVYTRTGDKGTTSLVGGRIVPKSDPRIEAYGTVDELMVWMGMAREALTRTAQSAPAATKPLALLDSHLEYIQNLLFTVNGDLATRIEDRWPGMPLIAKDEITYLERLIDRCNAVLPPLTDFILPGGGRLSLALHACRVVCRRAERKVHLLAEREPIGELILPFLNRLSDLFFVLARWVVDQLAESQPSGGEVIWRRGLASPPLPSAGTKRKKK